MSNFLISLRPRGSTYDLTSMTSILQKMNQSIVPSSSVPILVHTTGTNGKGSVCAMLESVLRASGRRTGMYTSPHLGTNFCSVIRINNNPVPKKIFEKVV
eukprot:PhF_6_TR521/c0_g1_i1/m.313